MMIILIDITQMRKISPGLTLKQRTAGFMDVVSSITGRHRNSSGSYSVSTLFPETLTNTAVQTGAEGQYL